MSSNFVEKVVVLGTSDTLIYECPVVQMGSVHGLVFSNTTSDSVAVTLKMYQQNTGLTITVASGKLVEAFGQFAWPKAINMAVGDRIIASAASADSISVVASIYMTTTGTVVNIFNPRGEWSAVASYIKNDVVSVGTTSYLAVNDSINAAPPSTDWMTLASRGIQGTAGADGAPGLPGLPGTNGVDGVDGVFDPLSPDNPTTLAGYGITDAVPVSQLSYTNVANTVVQRDDSGNFAANTITASLAGNSTTASRLQTARAINGVSFDGSADIGFTTDSVSEGAANLYHTVGRSRSALSAIGTGLTYSPATGEFTFSGVASVAGQSGHVTLAANDVGLGNVLNSPQVINAGGVPSVQAGTLAARPAAASAGRMYIATDTMEFYRDVGNDWLLIRGALTGDVSSTKGSSVLSLAAIGTAGSYTKVTTDTKGRVTAGSNPITLAGYGITNGLAKTGDTVTGNIMLDGGNILMANDETIDGRDVSADGAVLDAINQGTGFVSRADGGSVGVTTFAARLIQGTTNQVVVTNGDGTAGDPTISLSDYVRMPGTNGTALPIGTTAQRPSSPIPGTFRFNADTGAAESFNGAAWVESLSELDARVVEQSKLVVKNNPGKGQFATIGAAIAYLNSLTTNAPSSSNPYAILVSAGKYVENEIIVPPYVNVTGITEYAVMIEPSGQSHNQFVLQSRATLNHLTISGVGPGYSAIHVQNSGDFALAHKIDIFDCGYGITVKGSTGYTGLYLEYVAITGGDVAVNVEATNGAETFLNAENFYTFSGEDGSNQQVGVQVSGAGTDVNLRTFGLLGNNDNRTGLGLKLANGAVVAASAGTISGWDEGIQLANVGVGSRAIFVGMESMRNTSKDLHVAHPNSEGSLFGIANQSKVEINPASTFTVTYSDPANNALVSTGALMVGEHHSSVVDIAPLVTKGMQMGILEGGVLSRGTGLNVQIASGSGYAREAGNLVKLTWPTQTLAVAPSAVQYVFVNANNQVQVSTTSPSNSETVVLGRFMSNAVGITFIGSQGSLDIESFHPNLDKLLRTAIGAIYVSGSVVSENSTTARALNITAGHYFYSTSERKPAARMPATLVAAHRVSSVTTLVGTVQISNTQYDNGTDLTNLTAGYFMKHVIYTNGDGENVGYLMQWANAQYPTLEAAIQASNPPPLFSPDGSPMVAAVIMQQGNPNIVQILDLRPRIGGSVGSSSGGGASNHGDMLGLANDDHQQYMLANGGRTMGGSLNMGGYAIGNVGNVDGVDVSAHAARHAPNGSDPLPTAAPDVALGASSINSVGIANSFARSDHTHAITGVQPSSAVLDKVANISGTAGIVYRDAQGNFTSTALSVNLATQSTGNLSINQIASGTNASASTFLRGDGTWAVTDGVKSVNLIAPAAGIWVSGGPVTSTGSITLSLANDLAAIEGLSSTGIAVRTAVDSWAVRQIVGSSNQITITDAAGTTGNPTINLANNVVMPGTGSMTIPSGTTAQRPVVPVVGMSRYNTTTGRNEFYADGSWRNHVRLSGDTFSGAVVFNSNVDLTSFLDISTQAAPALPAAGKRRIYGTTVGGIYTAIDAVDSTGLVTRMFRDTITAVQNNSGATITKGRVVYTTGSVGGLYTVALARSNSTTTMPAIGIAAEDIPNGASGRIILAGKVSGLDTSPFTAGAILYVSATTAGTLTSIAPIHPNLHQPVASVLVSNGVSGEIMVAFAGVDGEDSGTIASSFTVGATTVTSMKLVPSSTVQRTFTYPDVSGTVITSGNLQTITATGDVTGSGTSSLPLTLANSGVAAASYGSGNSVPVIAVDAKGRVTSASSAPISINPPWDMVTGRPQTIISTITPRSTTAVVPFDTSAPASTEGTVLTSSTVTPTTTGSMFTINLSVSVTTGTANRTVVLSVFRGTTRVSSAFVTTATAGYMQTLSLTCVDMPNNGLNPVTYTTRIGASSSTTTYINQGTSATMGGPMSAIVITEVLPTTVTPA